MEHEQEQDAHEEAVDDVHVGHRYDGDAAGGTVCCERERVWIRDWRTSVFGRRPSFSNVLDPSGDWLR
jgi:hypothetical protein